MTAPLLANMPNEKVLKIFNATFSSPKDVTWFDHADYYDVSFVQAGIRSNIKYDKEGNFLSSMRYYGEENLPVNIVCQLKKRFPAKKVFGVTELTTSEQVNYYIKLQDDKFWTTLKVSTNGQMIVTEKFRKA
jgi:hypothetical protein